MTVKPRILFLAEAATLAHVVRPTVLAAALDRSEYEVCLATSTDFRSHVEAAGLPVRDLYCIGTRAYLAAVSAGRPVSPPSTYLARLLAQYLSQRYSSSAGATP